MVLKANSLLRINNANVWLTHPLANQALYSQDMAIVNCYAIHGQCPFLCFFVTMHFPVLIT